MKIHFFKYHGAGNDFVLLDNRSHTYDSIKNQDKVAQICHRRFGVGADGLMMLENEPGFDFKMVYYNADGNLGSMCGNGGRCIVAFAHHLGITKSTANFIAADGKHEATVIKPHYIDLKMNDLKQMDIYPDHIVLNTGSPHYIEEVNNLEDYPVFEKGKAIRYSKEFPKGINVNFIEQKENNWYIRTYERGVEDETWACGTGATAAALAIAELKNLYNISELRLQAKGGALTIKFKRTGPGYFEDVWLCGGAEYVYEGNLEVN